MKKKRKKIEIIINMKRGETPIRSSVQGGGRLVFGGGFWVVLGVRFGCFLWRFGVGLVGWCCFVLVGRAFAWFDCVLLAFMLVVRFVVVVCRFCRGCMVCFWFLNSVVLAVYGRLFKAFS